MGLFDEQVAFLRDRIALRRSEGALRSFDPSSCGAWPRGSSLVLEEQTAVELGNPARGSLSLILWTREPLETGDTVMLLGPDIGEIGSSGAPLAQVVLAAGDFDDAYATHRSIREAVYDTALQGFMSRLMPSRQSIWCRVSRDALQEGLSLAHLGSAIVAGIRQAMPVDAVQVLFITKSKQEILGLRETAEQVRRVTGALIKMSEETHFDCSSCEYRVVCETVEDIARLRRQKLARQADGYREEENR
jgi:CO dehydrogenase/acetyl-CoA synthase beta subunit